MTPLAEETIARRARLGMPVTPEKRIARRKVAPALPVIVEPPKQKVSAMRPLTRGPHWSRIVHEVAIKHDIDAKTIMGTSRYAHIIKARNEAFYRMRNEITVLGAPMTLPDIGRRFGKDHATVLNGIRNHERSLANG